jgi:hypothetical protein
MSSLSRVEDRALSALSRIERALQGMTPAGAQPSPSGEADRTVLERDCELLRQECETLRHEVVGLRARQERLVAVMGQVEGRLDGAIGQIDELARE